MSFYYLYQVTTESDREYQFCFLSLLKTVSCFYCKSLPLNPISVIWSCVRFYPRQFKSLLKRRCVAPFRELYPQLTSVVSVSKSLRGPLLFTVNTTFLPHCRLVIHMPCAEAFPFQQSLFFTVDPRMFFPQLVIFFPAVFSRVRSRFLVYKLVISISPVTK